MLTENQQSVFDWLNDTHHLPVFAEVYRGALDILAKKSPGYITFVSHAGRDLMNILVPTVKERERKQVQYVQLVEKLKDSWKDEWGEENSDTTSGTENGHLIPYTTCKNIKHLIDEHKAGRDRVAERDSAFFTTFLNYPDRESIPSYLSQEWRHARIWFGAHAHLREGEFEIEASYEVERHFRTLDDFLYAAAGSELGQLRRIDEILEEANE